MSLRDFLRIAHHKTPFFPGKTAVQGIEARHLFLFATIQMLVETGAKRHGEPISILEVGTYMGSSCLTWAEALHRYNDGAGSIVCIDPLEPYASLNSGDSSGKSELERQQEQYRTEMQALLAHDHVIDILMHNVSTIAPPVKVVVIRQKSATVLPFLAKGAFDVVYIDGDHAYSAVKADVELCRDLVRDNGILCGDDLDLQLHQVDAAFARVHATGDLAIDPKTQKQYHPGVTLAVAEALGEVPSYGGFWAVQKGEGARFSPPPFKASIPFVLPSHFPPETRERIAKMMQNLERGLPPTAGT